MNFVSKAAIIGGATLAVLAMATPASADPWSGGDVIVGDYGTTNLDGASWYVDSLGNIGHSYRAFGGQDFDRVVCGEYGGLMIDDSYVTTDGDLDKVVADNGDIVISGTGTFGDLDATLEYRVFASGDVLRTVYILTNNTGSAITVTPSTYEDPSDSYGQGSTSSGDEMLGSSDNWYQVYDTQIPSALYTKLFGSLQIVGEDIINPVQGGSDEVTFADITIPAGESYQFILFHSYVGYDVEGDEASDINAAAAAAQAVIDEFDGGLALSERLATGLIADIDGNFTIASDEEAVEEEALAETGVNATTGIVFGAAALAAGAVLVLRRRTV
ncbi:LPXTG-motif cell wall-anchored protein [Microbacteriaceae bacterium MWH-Ta3]|nr:LPXTG-motif cell wall-anchored protein [Microbacteriaceae bacterium MWH-Ta3]